jgi:hypothetical protein
MPLPTLDKTYEFDLNNQVLGVGSGGQTDGTPERKELLFNIVASLIGGGPWTVPWTVVASSDSVTSGFDGPGTNRWASSANVIWSQDGARSWIVIANTGLGISLCIECSCLTNTEGGGIRVFASKVGFGAANGGTDGSTTVRPTATDNAELRNRFNNSDGCWSGAADNAARAYRWHIVASDDGEVWNVCIYHNAYLVGFWRWAVPKNPPVGWNSPAVLQMLGGNSDAEHADTDTRAGISSDGHITCLDGTRRGTRAGQQISGQNDSQRTPVFPYSWGVSSGGFVMCKNSNAAVHPITGNPLMYPIWWWTRATAMGRGRLGSAYDLWLKTLTVGGAVGDTYPSNPATPQFFVAGENYIIPWNGVTAPLIS